MHRISDRLAPVLLLLLIPLSIFNLPGPLICVAAPVRDEANVAG